MANYKYKTGDTVFLKVGVEQKLETCCIVGDKGTIVGGAFAGENCYNVKTSIGVISGVRESKLSKVDS